MVAFTGGEPESGNGPSDIRSGQLPGTVCGHGTKFRATGKARRHLLHARQAQRCVRSERQGAATADDPVATRPRDARPGAVAGHVREGRSGVRFVSTVAEGIPRLPGPACDLSKNAAARPFSKEGTRGGENSERG